MNPSHRYGQELPRWASKRETVFMPTEVSSRVGFFDRFAGFASRIASQAPFFAFCLLLVLLWLLQGAISIALSGNFASFQSAKYQLEINTTTTIITGRQTGTLTNAETGAMLSINVPDCKVDMMFRARVVHYMGAGKILDEVAKL